MFHTKKLIALACVGLLSAQSALALDGPCTVNETTVRGVLYKSQNHHGGRGPSFLVSYRTKSTWPPCRSLPVYNINGEKISKFGCYDPGHLPYGRRFYQGVPGGSYHSAARLKRLAKLAGSPKIFVDQSKARDKSRCVVVNDPTSERQTTGLFP
ncbi:MAG: hypothetical protein J0M12_13500 [Deltaproteobacteria bacterium]|nr:hypothetical protein [Deltaproteobacteria bacterium]